jgi:threonine dehydratase
MMSWHELETAASVVYQSMAPTPQYCWPKLSARAGCEVWVKHENHTPTGAFKVRGGLVYLNDLKRRMEGGARVAGLVSATRGNHGQSLAFAGRRAGVPVTICVPRGNSRDQNLAIRGHGAELVEAGEDFDSARAAAGRLAEERGLEMVPPFHPLLVRGVATYGLELLRAAAGLDAVYVAIGMGSGICGLIAVRDLLGRSTEIVGVVSDHAPAFALSFGAGRVVTTGRADTFADGVACREPQPEALGSVRRGAARVLRVTDDEAAAAVRALHEDAHSTAEGAAGVALAGLLQERHRMRGRGSPWSLAAVTSTRTCTPRSWAVARRGRREPRRDPSRGRPTTRH